MLPPPLLPDELELGLPLLLPLEGFGDPDPLLPEEEDDELSFEANTIVVVALKPPVIINAVSVRKKSARIIENLLSFFL